MSLRDEILEQPAALARLLDAGPRAYASLTAALRARRPRFAVICARGTSDNAAIYAQYLFAVRNSLPVALAAPSTITLYGARPDVRDALVIGISQSGRSPDIVAVLEEAHSQGALTVVLVNDAESPLADVAILRFRMSSEIGSRHLDGATLLGTHGKVVRRRRRRKVSALAHGLYRREQLILGALKPLALISAVAGAVEHPVDVVISEDPAVFGQRRLGDQQVIGRVDRQATRKLPSPQAGSRKV